MSSCQKEKEKIQLIFHPRANENILPKKLGPGEVKLYAWLSLVMIKLLQDVAVIQLEKKKHHFSKRKAITQYKINYNFGGTSEEG
jgi:hypothetical protein